MNNINGTAISYKSKITGIKGHKILIKQDEHS